MIWRCCDDPKCPRCKGLGYVGVDMAGNDMTPEDARRIGCSLVLRKLCCFRL